jgi:hypothetical protein
LSSISRSGGQPSKLCSCGNYEAHGRQWKITDTRNGPACFAFNSADEILAITTLGQREAAQPGTQNDQDEDTSEPEGAGSLGQTAPVPDVQPPDDPTHLLPGSR